MIYLKLYLVACIHHSLNTEVDNLPEHVVGVEGGHPVAIGIRVVVTCSPAVTFNEGHLAETFQT